MTSVGLKFAGRTVGHLAPPFIIAEISGNHNGSVERALKIVDAAADAGVDAIKLQTYTADTMTLNLDTREFRIRNPKSLWRGESLYRLYQKAHTPWKWHKPLFDRCRRQGIVGFSTPFDSTSVDFLESLRVPLYKIASFENVDLSLIKKVASIRKPLIISTGLATRMEMEEAVKTARDAGCRQLALLKCTSAYPAPATESNIITIPQLRQLFGCEIGISDHTPGIGVSVAAVALGATIIERHVTLSRADGGVDSAFSLEPHELKQLVVEARRAWQALGSIHFGPTPSERSSLIFRRSLYIVEDMQKGEPLTVKTLRAIRPGLGLPPKHYESLLGQRVSRNVKKGTPVRWQLIG